MSAASPSPSFGRSEPPPLTPKTFVPVWLGRGEVEVGFTILTQQILWYATHWCNARRVPCLSSIGACSQCDLGWEARPTGFLKGLKSGSGGIYLLQVTVFAFKECTDLQRLNGELRGNRFSLRRLGKTKQSPWAWKLYQKVFHQHLPSGDGVEDVLSRLWGINLQRLATDPPANGDASTRLHPFSRQKERFQ